MKLLEQIRFFGSYLKLNFKPKMITKRGRRMNLQVILKGKNQTKLMPVVKVPKRKRMSTQTQRHEERKRQIESSGERRQQGRHQ